MLDNLCSLLSGLIEMNEWAAHLHTVQYGSEQGLTAGFGSHDGDSK